MIGNYKDTTNELGKKQIWKYQRMLIFYTTPQSVTASYLKLKKERDNN